jgi:hypothetical protein
MFHGWSDTDRIQPRTINQKERTMNTYNLLSDAELEKAANVGPGFIGNAVREQRVKGLLRIIIADATPEERLVNRNKLIHLLNIRNG